MTRREPDFDDLVGRDLDPEERTRLLRVHELLVAAGPPPDFEPELPQVAVESSVTPIRRPRRLAILALAAAFALASFGAGFFVGDRGQGAERVVAMAGSARAQEASASLELFSPDEAGNWPMELEVSGLTPPSSGRPYELWLTKGTRLAALCGSFRAEADGSTRVPLNAPYRLTDFDGWVIVEEGSSKPLLTTA